MGGKAILGMLAFSGYVASFLLFTACGPPFDPGSREECQACEKQEDCQEGLHCVASASFTTGKACFKPGAISCTRKR